MGATSIFISLCVQSAEILGCNEEAQATHCVIMASARFKYPICGRSEGPDVMIYEKILVSNRIYFPYCRLDSRYAAFESVLVSNLQVLGVKHYLHESVDKTRLQILCT